MIKAITDTIIIILLAILIVVVKIESDAILTAINHRAPENISVRYDATVVPGAILQLTECKHGGD